jgi:hypothetical protein
MPQQTYTPGKELLILPGQEDGSEGKSLQRYLNIFSRDKISHVISGLKMITILSQGRVCMPHCPLRVFAF